MVFGALVLLAGCRGGAEPSPAKGLPGLEALGFHLEASDFDHGFINDSFLAGDRIHLAAITGLGIVEADGSGSLTQLSALATTGDYPFSDVVVQGDVAYVAAGDRDRGTGALEIIDVSDVSAPVALSTFALDSPAISVALSEGVAYVGAFDRGLEILDVHAPASPRRLATWQLPDAAAYTKNAGTAHVWWPAVKPPYAYVTYDGAGLHVLDISDPSAPVRVGSFNKDTSNGLADCFFNEAEVDGDLVYVALDYCGLLVLDVSDPAHPAELGYANVWNDAAWEVSAGHAIQIELDGQRLFLSTSRDGVYVFDVSDPRAPRLTHALPESHAAGKGCAWGLSLSADTLVIDYTLCLPVSGIRGGVEVWRRQG